MRTANSFKRFGFFLGAVGLLWAPTALAQTPVNSSVQISGSCSKCDLSHRIMPRVSLQGSNFSGSDFSHSNVAGGKFYKSNLEGASFNKAYMMRVKGKGVNLRKAILRDATLTEATLIDSDISFADLRRADLTGANFTGSSFEGSILKSTDAMEANFEAVNFTGARLSHGNFEDASFKDADLTGVTFGDAILENCDFSGATMEGAHLYEATGLTQKQLKGACGDEATILPEGLRIRQCPEERAPRMLADNVREDISVTIAPAPHSPVAPPRMPYILKSKVYAQELEMEMSALDHAAAEIQAAMRDLPMGSPTHIRLEKSLELIAQARSQNE
jgi:uncharacterized protein YjbI with pentapeptide repeats